MEKTIPIFDGTGEAYWWLIQLERYFEANSWLDEGTKVEWVSLLSLRGEALKWWSSWKQDNLNAAWKDFEKGFIKEFIPDLWEMIEAAEEAEQKNRDLNEEPKGDKESKDNDEGADSGYESPIDAAAEMRKTDNREVSVKKSSSVVVDTPPPLSLDTALCTANRKKAGEASEIEEETRVMEKGSSKTHGSGSFKDSNPKTRGLMVIQKTEHRVAPSPPPEPPSSDSHAAALPEPKPPDPDWVWPSFEIVSVDKVGSLNDPPLSETLQLPSITAGASGAAMSKRGWLGLRLQSLLVKGEAAGFSNEERRKEGAAERGLLKKKRDREGWKEEESGHFLYIMGQAQTYVLDSAQFNNEGRGLILKPSGQAQIFVINPTQFNNGGSVFQEERMGKRERGGTCIIWQWVKTVGEVYPELDWGHALFGRYWVHCSGNQFCILKLFNQEGSVDKYVKELEMTTVQMTPGNIQHMELFANDSLIKSAQPRPAGINQIHPSLEVHGNICNLIEAGCLVKFFSDLNGFALREKAVDDQQPNNLETNYTGQSNCCSASNVRSGMGRVPFTLKQPSYSSIDAFFIQQHFLKQARVANLQYGGSDAFYLEHDERFEFSVVAGEGSEKVKDVGIVMSFEKYSDVSVIINFLRGETVLEDFKMGALVLVIPIMEQSALDRCNVSDGVSMFVYGVIVSGATYITYGLSYGWGFNASYLEEWFAGAKEKVMSWYSSVLTKQWDPGKTNMSMVVTAHEGYLRNFPTFYRLLNFVYDRGKLWGVLNTLVLLFSNVSFMDRLVLFGSQAS